MDRPYDCLHVVSPVSSHQTGIRANATLYGERQSTAAAAAARLLAIAEDEMMARAFVCLSNNMQTHRAPACVSGQLRVVCTADEQTTTKHAHHQIRYESAQLRRDIDAVPFSDYRYYRSYCKSR